MLLAALAFWARSKLKNFFYPVAPPMPAVVTGSMEEILARLESVLRINAPHVLDGLQPGLSAADISKLEEQYHVQLSPEIKAIYQWHNGARRTTTYVGDNFIPIHRFVPLEETLADNVAISKGPTTLVQKTVNWVFAGHRKSWICLFSDGCGDGYWFDPRRRASKGAVFYNFTEDASYVFFPSAKNLVAGIIKCYEEKIYRVKPGSSPPELDEDFKLAGKVWAEFGASNLR